MADTTFIRIIRLIKRIPRGRVATYGQIALLAGSPNGARQVVRALHNSSSKERLPWHRVVNARGQISLGRGQGFELQRSLLQREGVSVSDAGVIDLAMCRWRPRRP